MLLSLAGRTVLNYCQPSVLCDCVIKFILEQRAPPYSWTMACRGFTPGGTASASPYASLASLPHRPRLVSDGHPPGLQHFTPSRPTSAPAPHRLKALAARGKRPLASRKCSTSTPICTGDTPPSGMPAGHGPPCTGTRRTASAAGTAQLRGCRSRGGRGGGGG